MLSHGGNVRRVVLGVVAVGVVLVLVAGFLFWRSRQVGPLTPEPQVQAAAARIVQTHTAAGEAVTLLPKHPNGALVVYTHGNGQTARAIYAGTGNPGVSAALLEAGYTVAASDAYGNNWGNAESVRAYVDLVKTDRQRYGLDRVFVISESMGSLAGLQLADAVHARAWAAYFPVCDLSSLLDQDDIAAGVKAADPDVEALSPASVPEQTPVMIWASHDDTRVPPAENAEVCASEAGSEGHLVWTSGNHGDPSNFRPADVVAFFEAA